MGFSWAFLAGLSPEWCQSYPPTNDGWVSFELSEQRPYVAIDSTCIAQRIDSFFIDSVSKVASNVVASPIRVLSFNVCTLARPCRRALLYHHLRLDRVHIACLQETRAKQSRVQVDDSFIRIASAADSGSYGCEVLISMRLPFAHDGAKPVCITQDDVSVVFDSPRCLIVLLCSRAIRLAIVCAHAPHSSAALADDFWDVVRASVLSLVPSVYQILVCADVNGVLAPLASPAVGERTMAAETSRTSVPFLSFCDGAQLYIPVTFPVNNAVNSDLATYVTSDGQHYTQQDFICISSSAYCTPASCSSVRHFDISQKRDDHFPVVAEVRFACGDISHMTTSRRRSRIRPRCVPWSDLEKQHMRMCLSAVPPVPWFVDPDSHLFVLVRHLASAIGTLPPRRPLPRRQHISAVTMDMVLLSRHALRSDHSNRRRLRRVSLWAVFGLWSGRIWRCRWCVVRGFATKSLCMRVVFGHYAARAASSRTAAYARLDWLVFLSDSADRTETILSGPCSSSIHALVRSMRPRPAAKMARLASGDGIPASSYHAERVLVRSHFASVLNGQCVRFATLLDQSRFRRMSLPFPVAQADDSLCPSVTDIARMLRTTGRHKAVGEDCVGGDVWSTFADLLAPHLHALSVKSISTVAAPLAWKGGMLMELWKGRGSTCDISSYRDIMLQDHPAKIHGAVLRPALRAIAETATRGTQWGSGLHAGSTEVAHLAMRAMMDVAKLQRVSGAVLFLDVVSAFASFRRRIVLDCHASDKQWLRHLVSLGFAADQAQSIVTDACSLVFWNSSGASDHLVQLLGDMYTDSWFSTEGIDRVVRFDSGSMAGTTLADLVFAIAMSKILSALHSRLSDTGLVPCAPCSSPSDVFGGDAPAATEFLFSEVSFVDDVAVPLLSPAPSLTSSVATAAAVAHDVFAEFGLVLNFKPGKSEAILFWAGQKSEQARRVFTIDERSRIVVQSRIKFELPVCRSYKHLGTRVSFAPSSGEEAKVRAGIIGQDVRTFRRRLLAQDGVPVEKRLTLAKAVLMSRGLYQAGTWAVLDGHPFRKLHHAVMSVYRALSSSYWRGNAVSLPSDDEVLRNLGAPSLGMLIKVARLQLFGRIAIKMPSTLLLALCCAMPLKTSWLSVVRFDLSWLASVSSEIRSDSSLSDWSAFIRANPKGYRRMISEASHKFGASFIPARASRTVVAVGASHVCLHCSLSFASHAALCSHNAHKHWHICEARRYVRTTQCPVCCLECHTRSRVVHHIGYRSPVCMDNLRIRNDVLPSDEVESLDRAEHDRIRSCQSHSQLSSAAAYRANLPVVPVRRADGSWWRPGDRGHPLGPNRRLLLHTHNA